MIHQIVILPKITAREVYDLLLDSKKHSELTGDKAQIDPRVGGTFSTFGGYSDGVTRELVEGQVIEQTWRASDWEDGHYSTIRFELEALDEGMCIRFSQWDLPEGSEDEFIEGWQDNYWTPLLERFS